MLNEADKVISLSKTNNGFNGNGKRAGPAPRSTPAEGQQQQLQAEAAF